MTEEQKMRLVEEHKQLMERIEKLESFLGSEEFQNMENMSEKADLICQEHAMVLYERFLGNRCYRYGLLNDQAENN